MRAAAGLASLEAIDWKSWTAVDRATLLFVVRGGEILLIRKKRGLGAGKINGPGGRLDPGESWRQAALREVQEEVGVRPVGVRQLGDLRFQFVDGYSIHVRAFRADDCVGTPAESNEAIPRWVPIEHIPYDEMWRDDEIWLPLLLAGKRFTGRFVFDDDTMLDHDVTEVSEETTWSG